ncbi:restriction system protein [Stenotrophomonas geniculata]|uniref:restriction endonuclease n=1 Tax=Stenotrophomonas geniculata TaxID=86188 RepID=UPI00374C0C89
MCRGDLYRHFADHPEDLCRLPRRDFEELISSVFTARGWRTQIAPGTADEGVDVRMWLQSPLGYALTLVQARRYAKHRPIGLEAMAALEAHSLRENASGLFATTSRYRRVAQRFASRNKKLLLVDSSDVATWCQEASAAVQSAKAKALALDSVDRLLAEVTAGTPSGPGALHGEVRYWGAGDLYSPWKGEALGFDFWD